MTGQEVERRALGRPSRRIRNVEVKAENHAQPVARLPFNRLVLSQANMRRIKAGVSIEELAEDIARRTLLQSLAVRPVRDDDGVETGMFEVPAGGRRYRALELLVKQKRLARTAPIPCVVRTEGLAEEDSLAENVQRAPLHPLDQFRAFLSLREKGMSEEEIAAAFFVSVHVVKQRLKLAAASPKLLDIYAQDGMTLDQLMAFTVNPDHEHQEQVWEALQRSHAKEPYYIRRLLTEGAVRASDKRAEFIGPTKLPVAPSCEICSSRTMAAGCRIPYCSIGLLLKNFSAKPMWFGPKAGSGWTSPPTFPMATPMDCATSRVNRSR
jgi:ParB/RepB/Spo0J family partition protein